MTEYHPADSATLYRLRPGCDEEISFGSMAQILAELRAGEHGKPGSLRLQIDGHISPIFGRALAALVEEA